MLLPPKLVARRPQTGSRSVQNGSQRGDPPLHSDDNDKLPGTLVAGDNPANLKKSRRVIPKQTEYLRSTGREYLRSFATPPSRAFNWFAKERDNREN